jgi:hypothetical protein
MGYWSAVEELRQTNRSSWHQLGAEIFYTYINTPSPDIKVGKVITVISGYHVGSKIVVFCEVVHNKFHIFHRASKFIDVFTNVACDPYCESIDSCPHHPVLFI